MNVTHTPLSNALDVITLRELMFVKLNGPPVA